MIHPQAVSHVYGLSPSRQAGFDVVGNPTTVEELAYVIQLLCQLYIGPQTDRQAAVLRVQTALLDLAGKLQLVQKPEEVTT